MTLDPTIMDSFCNENYTNRLECNALEDGTCPEDCEMYVDPRVQDIIHTIGSGVTSTNMGICVSDGSIDYDPVTGELTGLLKTDEECGVNVTRSDCNNLHGYGCQWEELNNYCVPSTVGNEGCEKTKRTYIGDI